MVDTLPARGQLRGAGHLTLAFLAGMREGQAAEKAGNTASAPARDLLFTGT
jgi:hypothetical protein